MVVCANIDRKDIRTRKKVIKTIFLINSNGGQYTEGAIRVIPSLNTFSLK